MVQNTILLLVLATCSMKDTFCVQPPNETLRTCSCSPGKIGSRHFCGGFVAAYIYIYIYLQVFLFCQILMVLIMIETHFLRFV